MFFIFPCKTLVSSDGKYVLTLTRFCKAFDILLASVSSLNFEHKKSILAFFLSTFINVDARHTKNSFRVFSDKRAFEERVYKIRKVNVIWKDNIRFIKLTFLRNHIKKKKQFII